MTELVKSVFPKSDQRNGSLPLLLELWMFLHITFYVIRFPTSFKFDGNGQFCRFEKSWLMCDGIDEIQRLEQNVDFFSKFIRIQERNAMDDIAKKMQVLLSY